MIENVDRIFRTFDRHTTKISLIATQATCQASDIPDNGAQTSWENPALAGAEGATAPETLRPKDHEVPIGTLENRAARVSGGPLPKG